MPRKWLKSTLPTMRSSQLEPEPRGPNRSNPGERELAHLFRELRLPASQKSSCNLHCARHSSTGLATISFPRQVPFRQFAEAPLRNKAQSEDISK
jgi:hypothetical protein